MADRVDLKTLLIRQNERVEWKENVADTDDVAETLSAFANDWSNLGGGYVVCGAKEGKDEHGFPRVSLVGLSSSRLKEVEGKVLTACRDRVSPSITPLVEELPADSAERRVLVFIMPATRSAHLFRRKEEAGKYFVRVSRETREARNGVLRELLVRKGAMDEWDRRTCSSATVDDLDLLVLRDALQQLRIFNPNEGVEPFLSDSRQLSSFVPPLCVREPLTQVLRPRNFAVLLFGRNVQLHIPGAYALFSIYPGMDRSERHAERHEIAGTLMEQAKRLLELLDAQSYVVFDKADRIAPNALKYPHEALHEAMMNALAHRNYELAEPTRTTVFSDRIEIVSPGSLPSGVSLDEFQLGRAPTKWRNQTLAWFLSRLQFAQGEGQGIPTILRSMREEGCPPPQFDANEARVTCVLRSHPRHALLGEYKRIEEALSSGRIEEAQLALAPLLTQDPANPRAVQLFAELHRIVNDAAPVRDFIRRSEGKRNSLPATVLTQLADVLWFGGNSPTPEDLALSHKLYLEASIRNPSKFEVGKIATGLRRNGDPKVAFAFLDSAMQHHHELNDNAWILRIRAEILMEVAAASIQAHAWDESISSLNEAEKDLRRAASLAEDDPAMQRAVTANLESIGQLQEMARSRR